MARLIATAFSEDTIAAPGNRQPNYIIVSGTDVNGVPITGPAATNFKVDAMIGGPGGAPVNILSVAQGDCQVSATLMSFPSQQRHGTQRSISLQ